MIKNLFKRKKEDEEPAKSSPVIAMVMLEDIIELSADIIKPYTENNTDMENVQIKDNTITFEIEGELGFVSLMPGPIPWSDLEGPCSTAWYWEDAAKVLKNHKAHLIAAILPKNQQKKTIDRFKSVTKIVSSVISKDSRALGVYWGSGTVVQSRENFIERSKNVDSDDMPYELWIEFRVEVSEDKKCNVITTGMEAFGNKEIEIIKSSKDPLSILQFVFNIVDYLITSGPVIKDGDTVGKDKNQRIRVLYKKSIWDRPGSVMNISY